MPWKRKLRSNELGGCMLSSAKVLLKRVRMLEKVLSLEPQREERQDLDWNRLDTRQKETLVQAARILIKNKDLDNLTGEQDGILQEACEICDRYAEPESVIRARQLPLH